MNEMNSYTAIARVYDKLNKEIDYFKCDISLTGVIILISRVYGFNCMISQFQSIDFKDIQKCILGYIANLEQCVININFHSALSRIREN